MQLSGPRPTPRVQLMGLFDPAIEHPVMLVLGLAAGIYLASRRK
jgi:hypothetical protein